MSEFKWVPEVGMKVKVGNYNDPDYVGVLLPEFSHVEYPTSELVILSERRKKVLSWSCRSQILKPVGKKAKAHYAKAKKEWEDAQVIGAGDWVERITKDNSSVKVGDILKCISSAFGFICVDNGSPDECHFTEYFRKLTPAEVEAHEASLVPEFEVGSYVFLKDVPENNHENVRFKNQILSVHGIESESSKIWVHNASQNLTWFLRRRLRPATPEEIKAATRTVWSLEDGDEHWHLNHKGEVELFEWDSNLASCIKGRERGHVFLTRQEAEAEDARRVAANSRDGGGV